jgi:hypothetical protein
MQNWWPQNQELPCSRVVWDSKKKNLHYKEAEHQGKPSVQGLQCLLHPRDGMGHS